MRRSSFSRLRRVALASVTLVVASALGALAACSSTTVQVPASTDDAAADASADSFLEPVEAAPPMACKLVVGSGVKLCDDCLQMKCCVAINTCLNDKGCDALNTCYNSCGMRLGRTDAGVQCVRDCIAQRPDAATALEESLDCESTRCNTECM